MRTLFKDSNFGKFVGESYSVKFTREVFQVKKGYAYYWIKKKRNIRFHPKTQGGRRIYKFTEFETIKIKQILWSQCKMKPTLK